MVLLDSLLTASLSQSPTNEVGKSLGKDLEQVVAEQEQEIRRLKEENDRLRERIRNLEAAESQNNNGVMSLTKFGFLRASNISIGKKVGEGSFGAVYRGQ